MALTAFEVHLVSAIPMNANLSCVCEKCGHTEKREGIVVGLLVNDHMKYVLSRDTQCCPGCHAQGSGTAFFTLDEASRAVSEVMRTFVRAQHDKVLAAQPLAELISIIPAEYDCPEEVEYEPQVLNS